MFQPGKYYHLYNHANGFENIFKTEDNYRFFLQKYASYLNPIADTYNIIILLAYRIVK
jgi:hypothetical protein